VGVSCVRQALQAKYWHGDRCKVSTSIPFPRLSSLSSSPLLSLPHCTTSTFRLLSSFHSLHFFLIGRTMFSRCVHTPSPSPPLQPPSIQSPQPSSPPPQPPQPSSSPPPPPLFPVTTPQLCSAARVVSRRRDCVHQRPKRQGHDVRYVVPPFFTSCASVCAHLQEHNLRRLHLLPFLNCDCICIDRQHGRGAHSMTRPLTHHGARAHTPKLTHTHTRTHTRARTHTHTLGTTLCASCSRPPRATL
jgi:hypothetical protein